MAEAPFGVSKAEGPGLRLMEVNQSFSDSSEAFAKAGGGQDMMIALLTVEAGHWTSGGRQTAGPDRGSLAWNVCLL